MNIEQVNRVFFLGIGGIGMSAIARYFLQKGATVSGYDRTPSPLTLSLQNEGAHIIFEDDPSLIDSSIPSNQTLFIYTPAIPKNNKIREFLLSKDYQLYKRSEVLGFLSKKHQCIAIAGTHGKTTISSMTAHILYQSRIGCQAFLGGILKNYESNFLLHETSDLMVAEADEYDRSFLQLEPQMALISSMDADHLDIYGNQESMQNSFKEFARKVKADGFLLVHHRLSASFSDFNHIKSYSLENSDSDFYASNIKLNKGYYHFNFHHPKGIIRDLQLMMPGIINLENSIGAIALSLNSGLSEDEIRNGLHSFQGIKRRLELIVSNENCLYYDDYAHHPEEIKAVLGSLKLMYPDQKLTVMFQPHLYSRTRDFADGFAESLSIADQVILLDIYPAREEPIPNVSSQIILNQISHKNKIIIKKSAVVDFFSDNKPELMVTLGAGDIDRLIEPLKNLWS